MSFTASLAQSPENVPMIATPFAMFESTAKALEMIASKLNEKGGQEAARLALARDYVAMYGEMGQKSNTIMFNERPADANALLAQAMMSMTAATNALKPPAIEDGTEPVEAAMLEDGIDEKVEEVEKEERN